MSNKNQDIPPPSTKETLGSVIKRASELSRYLSENYSDGDIRKFSISRNTNIEGDKWKAHSLIFGLADILRLFFLSRDGIALYPIKPSTLKLGASRKLEPEDVPLRQLLDVSPNWYNAIDQTVIKINELFYGIGAPLMPSRLTYAIPITINP